MHIEVNASKMQESIRFCVDDFIKKKPTVTIVQRNVQITET